MVLFLWGVFFAALVGAAYCLGRIHGRRVRAEGGGRAAPLPTFPAGKPRPAGETAEEKKARVIHDNIEAYGTAKAQREVE